MIYNHVSQKSIKGSRIMVSYYILTAYNTYTL